MSEYRIWLCPVCADQFEDDSEWGLDYCTKHEEYGHVEPIEVSGRRGEFNEIRFDTSDLFDEWHMTTGPAMMEAEANRKAEAARWRALTCEERCAELDARDRGRSALHDEYQGALRDILHQNNRMMFGGGGGPYTTPCPRCHETFCENAVTRESVHRDHYGGFRAITGDHIPSGHIYITTGEGTENHLREEYVEALDLGQNDDSDPTD
jgi:hypothetical protein